MSRSHHSSMSRHRSSLSSRHHSSIGSMHRSSLSRMHHSSLSRRSTGTMNIRKSPFKHHGISDAHAFAVGKSTGININGSAMGAHGAALHRSKIRRNSMNNSMHNRSRRFFRTHSNMRRTIKFSSRNSRFKSRKYKFDPSKNNVNIEFTEYSKYMYLPFLIFFIFFVIMIFTVISSILRMSLFRF